MKRSTASGWTAGPQDAASGLLDYAAESGKARALPSIWMALRPLTNGERAGMLAARDGGDFHPWIYALAAIRAADGNRVFAIRCREAFLADLHGHSEADKAELLLDGAAFARFIGERLAAMIQDGGACELAAVARLLERIEGRVRDASPDERDLLRAIEAATQAAADVPTREAVRLIWKAGRKGRTAKQFLRALEGTGFEWLPSGRQSLFAHLLE
jgi:hypothetical protein